MTDDEERVSTITALQSIFRNFIGGAQKLSQKIEEATKRLKNWQAMVVGAFVTLILQRVSVLIWSEISPLRWSVDMADMIGGPVLPNVLPYGLGYGEAFWLLFLLIGVNMMGNASPSHQEKIRELHDRVERIEGKLEIGEHNEDE